MPGQSADVTLKKTGPNPTDRAKQGTKRSLLVDGTGLPLSVVTAGANRHDSKLLADTLDAVAVPLPLGEIAIGLCLDKGYDYAFVRTLVAERGLEAHIRSRGQEKAEKQRNPEARARRWVVERTHAWLNAFRGIKIRWVRDDVSYDAFLFTAMAAICLNAIRL